MLEVQRTCRVPFFALFSLERKKAKLIEVVEFRPYWLDYLHKFVEISKTLEDFLPF